MTPRERAEALNRDWCYPSTAVEFSARVEEAKQRVEAFTAAITAAVDEALVEVERVAERRADQYDVDGWSGNADAVRGLVAEVRERIAALRVKP